MRGEPHTIERGHAVERSRIQSGRGLRSYLVPNLFIVGAPRCGTTAMFSYLGQHPDIYPSSKKEPYFFASEITPCKTSEYLSLFKGATTERWLIEATPYYLVNPKAIERIREFSPQARLIVMLRNPVEMMYSLYQRRVCDLREFRALNEALCDITGQNFSYRDIGRYGEQLSRVFEVFERKDVHVIIYDDFASNPSLVYRKTLEFLEVNPSFAPSIGVINSHAEPRSRILQDALWRRESAARKVARTTLPQGIRQALWLRLVHANRRPAVRPPLDEAIRLELWPETDAQLLSRILDRDLAALWRPVAGSP